MNKYIAWLIPCILFACGTDEVETLVDTGANNTHEEMGNDVGTSDGNNSTSYVAADSDADNVAATCGDGEVADDEVCDDGNTDDGDYCAANCRTVTGRCGDGVVQSNERCDGEDCNADCQDALVSPCGNGALDAGEACDDGNIRNGDYCAADCQSVTGACGDGVVQGNEFCDDGNQDADDYCSADCQTATGSCGDQTTQNNESCDDGNTTDGDYCSADCQSITGSCGDSMMQNNEQCDDGNQSDSDYCSADCQMVTGQCGDSMMQNNEQCDDGNTDGGDYCSADCMTVTGSCGDGVRQSIEACDDGVTTDCAGTHNGGDGTCVATNTCSPGYTLDMGVCKPNNTTGLTVPCSNGSGYAMFKIHYDNFSTSARVDLWDASCNYSFVIGSACNVTEICPGFCDVNTTSAGYPIITSSHYWRARYSANGLNFTNATLWVEAHAYNSGSAQFEAWSPIYGSVFSGPVGFNTAWHSVDWSNHLSPTDQPSLTAIQLYGRSGSIAVKGVELCVE